jgi:hypothetical protein
MADIDPKTSDLFREAAIEMGCRGTEILDVYPDAWKDLQPDSPPSAFRAAVEAVRAKSPAMFVETRWEAIDENTFREKEKALRESLRTFHQVGPNPFKTLDAARLNPEEQKALTRHLQARGDSVDRSVLLKALSRQISEDALLTPKGAA